MTIESTDTLAVLVRKLGRLARLDEADAAAVSSLPHTVEAIGSGRYLVRDGKAATTCCLLLEGFACRHKLTANGARQIVSFHMPGDLVDVQHLLLLVADHNVQMVSQGKVAWIPQAELRQIAREHPRVADALWRDTLIDASIFREWVLNVGRRDAKTRVAHMLCEFAARREAAGLGSTESFELPMTQEEIADATGLTSVHVNRMLKALADDEVISREGRKVKISDWDRMRRVADFDAAYLHAAA